MVKVLAKTRGYIAGILREHGDVFEWPDDVKLGRWVKEYTSGEDPADTDPSEPVNEKPKKPGKAAKPGKATTVAAPVAEPFGDAPEPIRVTNEINAATGGTEPDWIAPQPVAD
ncbi:hypothetical protein HB779_17390 [Phyllobacterium sp. 628]|uniref:hypothetical protein n=1 Tax=Phyllobacterium sp. 628 TaxID=2718938 RepID=UPI0016624910|nr:hypothetical protein [Phyllobacterium sp. 628]QND53463.1 hypothetical protein HB779_17390 [Phyllobacterium sp. 628]